MAFWTIGSVRGNVGDAKLIEAVVIAWCVQRELSIRLGCHIVGYDYSGYGSSTGNTRSLNTLADAEACMQHLEETYGTSPEDIIVYGQSVGSGPTVSSICLLIIC